MTMRYKKKPAVLQQAQARTPSDTQLLGMLFVVNVRLVRERTRETVKHRLLLVGCEHADIERKIRWMFDVTEYREMSITGIEKVREKVHFLSSIVTQAGAPAEVSIARDEGTRPVPQQNGSIESYDPKLFAVGITTTMLAKDSEHALRKVGHALVSHATEGKSHSGASLSDDSTVVVEEVPRSNGYAMPRDVSHEVNRAHVMRG